MPVKIVNVKNVTLKVLASISDFPPKLGMMSKVSLSKVYMINKTEASRLLKNLYFNRSNLIIVLIR